MLHAWHHVSPGNSLPCDFQAVIKIPLGSSVKYESDKASGLLKVDRIIHSAVFYPANYGFIPQTYADDDPLGVLNTNPLFLRPELDVNLSRREGSGFATASVSRWHF